MKMYFDVCAVHLVQFIIQKNKCATHTHTHIYIYVCVCEQYFIYRKYSEMFRCTHIIFRDSYPSTVLKL